MSEDLTVPPSTEKPRTLARRRQVLEAAARCFRRHGFHACSMAEIAADAGMSVGHIYRYFKGKEAIIADIVREDLEEILAHADVFQNDTADLRTALSDGAADGVARASDPDRAALMVEIRAEAARNPVIGEMMRAADRQISDRLREMIAAAVGRPLSKTDLEARVEMFHMIFQGVSIRTAVNSDLDIKALSRIVKLTIDAILT